MRRLLPPALQRRRTGRPVRPRWGLLCLFLFVVVGADEVRAQDPASDIGIGGQIGDPSGVTLKLYQRPGFSYEFLAAWDLDSFFFLNGHALYERPIPDSPLRYYIGPGVIVGIRENANDETDLVVGISGQAGVNFFVERFEVFLHLTPRLDIIPSTDGDIGGGIGLRYYL